MTEIVDAVRRIELSISRFFVIYRIAVRAGVTFSIFYYVFPEVQPKLGVFPVCKSSSVENRSAQSKYNISCSKKKIGSMIEEQARRVVIVDRRLYDVRLKPSNWFRGARLVIDRIGIGGHGERIVKLGWKDESAMQAAYLSNSRLRDLIVGSDPYFHESAIPTDISVAGERRAQEPRNVRRVNLSAKDQ